MLSRLYAPDNSFRIFTWVVADIKMSSFWYFGLFQFSDTKRKKDNLIWLTDSSQAMNAPETKKLGPGNWYGAVYFKIIQNRKDSYSLLGWKGRDRESTRKVIEAFSFSAGRPVFGTNSFPSVDRNNKKSRNKYSRIIFEFNSSVVMSLKYNESEKMIVFDHLAPAEPATEGICSTYGPDFTYDALLLKKGKWIFSPNIEVRNSSEIKENPKKKHKTKPLYQSPK